MAFFWTYSGLKFGIKSVKFPKENDFYDGFISSIAFNEKKCLNFGNSVDTDDDLKCRKCESVCPTKAIRLDKLYGNLSDKTNADKLVGAIDISKCISCGLCIDICSDITEAINYGIDFACSAPSLPSADKNKIFKKSLFVKHIDTGSCGACESEISALNNPYYNMHRLGIFMTPSPRFADVLLVTGTYTKKMSDIFFNVLDNIPRPRYVVLIGACSLSGGIFEKSFRSDSKGLLFNDEAKKLFKEDNVVILPHCPPNPFEILSILLQIKKGDFK